MAALAAAGIAAGGSILGGVTGGKGAAKAARIQAQSQAAALAQQQSQFNVTQQNIQPVIGAGNSARDSIMQLLGLSGNGQQQTSIDALKASPFFTSQFDTGQDAILQNASATGGLRGGNVQNSLAQFGSGLLAQTIQQQLSNLGGLATTGANSAAGLGSISQNNSNAQSSLFGLQGNANAVGAAAPYSAFQSAIGGVGTALTNYLKSNGAGFTLDTGNLNSLLQNNMTSGNSALAASQGW
jgi:hypothetical protein